MRDQYVLFALGASFALVGQGCGGGSDSQVVGPPANRPPSISGNPAGSVDVGDLYDFRPTASDPDGDPLTFTIRNQPAWTSFDPATGRITGTPSLSDIGDYAAIEISVSDGTAAATLTPFLVTVSSGLADSITLTWTPPTRNTDGSVITDLAGYIVYYNVDGAPTDQGIRIDNPGIASYVLDNLGPGTYSIVVVSYNREGVESAHSNAVQQIIAP